MHLLVKHMLESPLIQKTYGYRDFLNLWKVVENVKQNNKHGQRHAIHQNDKATSFKLPFK